MAAPERVDFSSPVKEGEMVEAVARVDRTGNSSMRIAAELWAEELLTGANRCAAAAAFVMVAVDKSGRPATIA